MVSLAPEAGRLLRRVVVVGLLAIAMACFLMPYTPLYALTIAVWNKERGDSAWYFAVWVAVDTSVVLAAVVSAGDVAPVVAPPARTAKQHSRYRSALALARRTRHRLRCLRAKHASSFASRWLLNPDPNPNPNPDPNPNPNPDPNPNPNPSPNQVAARPVCARRAPLDVRDARDGSPPAGRTVRLGAWLPAFGAPRPAVLAAVAAEVGALRRRLLPLDEP